MFASVALAVGVLLLPPRGRRLSRARAGALSQLPAAPPKREGGAVMSRVGAALKGEGRPEAADPTLPLAADLLAACLAAGATPAGAAAAVGEAVEGEFATALRRCAREIRLGGDPASVWQRLGRSPGARTLARRLELADTGGAGAVEAVATTAAEQRRAQARAGQAGARRAAVLVTGPLGLCFLPAFLFIGVAPVVIGLAAELL
ncbi:hypothetical protein HCJ92_14370 [Streptomyces sp. ventii]|uniref:Type II secretion system protein GspF domain-containing protein n=2 Tax=Streptomyces spiramenti TaxID=2720606 RepID=A0ABX1AQX6_9ACTN|nr:hypothetical protein [Streptomyces spiramenti]